MIDLEQRLAKLQKQFHGLKIMGGEGVTVHGSPGRGYVVDVKAGVAQSGTSTGPPPVEGCTDPEAINFNPSATIDDGSCEYEASTGACCDFDGTCTVLTESDCLSNENRNYLGNDTICEEGTCPTGACCCPDSTDCSISTQFYCELCCPSCTYQGDNAPCDPNPCSTGACCYDDHTCEITTETSCTDSSGTYQGNDTTCEVDCPVYRHVHWEWTLVSDPEGCSSGTADYGSGTTDACYIEPVIIGSTPVSIVTTFTQHNCPDVDHPLGTDYDCTNGFLLGVNCDTDIFTCGYFGIFGCTLLDESCFCTSVGDRFTDTLTTYWDNTPC